MQRCCFANFKDQIILRTLFSMHVYKKDEKKSTQIYIKDLASNFITIQKFFAGMWNDQKTKYRKEG